MKIALISHDPRVLEHYNTQIREAHQHSHHVRGGNGPTIDRLPLVEGELPLTIPEIMKRKYDAIVMDFAGERVVEELKAKKFKGVAVILTDGQVKEEEFEPAGFAQDVAKKKTVPVIYWDKIRSGSINQLYNQIIDKSRNGKMEVARK